MTPPGAHLRAGGTSVLLVPSADGVPTLLHWGADLGELSDADLSAYAALRVPGVPMSALDAPRHLSVLPSNVAGYTGTPAVEVHRPLGRTAGDSRTLAWTPRFSDWQWSVEPAEAATASAGAVRLHCTDAEAGLSVVWELELSVEGVVRARSRLRNAGQGEVWVAALRTVLPVPAYAEELLDLTGRWCRERVPQRHDWQQGTWLRQGRHGRTGHDATLLMVAGTPGFGFGRGRVWGVHVAWSGDHQTYAERTPEGEALLGGGELLSPGEVVLAPGEEYAAPWLVAVWSDAGLDGLSDRLHPWVRRGSPRTRRPRPVVVNTWEATYMDHRLDKLTALADAAAEVGAERFVLDDGWFAGRHDDRAGLGDWIVDPDVWPDGLHPLVDHVRGLGLEFGLWVEPEMVNENSSLAREHPDWLLRGRSGLPDTWRFQQVLDLQHPDAYVHVRDALVALVTEYDIAYLKWDHNRDLIDVAHAGRPAVHGQTLAFYRLLDELRQAHPALEIESCSSGGARIDLGVLERTDRVWASDTLDPLLRTPIQRWTSLLVPPELVGAHIGGQVAHTTGRAARRRPAASSRYSCTMRRASTGRSNPLRARSRAAAPIRVRRAGSRTSCSRASASAAGSWLGTTRPSTPSRTTSGFAPTVVTTTGRPVAIASRMAIGWPSQCEGSVNSWAERRAVATSAGASDPSRRTGRPESVTRRRSSSASCSPTSCPPPTTSSGRDTPRAESSSSAPTRSCMPLRRLSVPTYTARAGSTAGSAAS